MLSPILCPALFWLNVFLVAIGVQPHDSGTVRVQVIAGLTVALDALPFQPGRFVIENY